MKDFYMVIYLVKQLMPGDEEALKQHLIKDYIYFHAFRNPAKVFSTYKAASDFFLKHSQECGFRYALNEPPYFLFMAIEKFTFLSDEKDLKDLISKNDIYHLQRLSNFVRIERSTGFKVFKY